MLHPVVWNFKKFNWIRILAIDILLNDRKVYTKEIMAGVIQHLVEQQPLPILLMRTILKALNAYSQSLIGFV